MKLFLSLLFSILFVSAIMFTGCSEEPVSPETPVKTPALSKLTLPAGAVITSAFLNIYVEDPSGNSATVHKVNVGWNESESWNTFFANPDPEFGPALLGFDVTPGLKAFNITTLVKEWVAGTTPNYGVLLNQPVSASGYGVFRSSEYLGSNQPFLEVTYTVGGSSPITVQEPAFIDTYIWSIEPTNSFGNEQYLRLANIDNYRKYVLVQFDIEQTICEEPIFLIIDEDGLDNGLHVNKNGGLITPSGPNFFTILDVNDDKPGKTQRDILRYFANNINRQITVKTGQTGDEAWFAPTLIPAKWISTYGSSNNTRLTDGQMQTGIRNYFGLNGTIKIPEQDRLDKIPHVQPLRALGLNRLIGKIICAVVYDSDISINYDHGTSLGVNGNLQGETLGIVSFRVDEVIVLNNFSSSTLPQVKITIMDASDCGDCALELLNAPVPKTSSVPVDRVPPGSTNNYFSF